MSKIKSLRRRYIEHRNNAKQRGIGFLLTFEQWETVWRESGKLSLRGVGKGQYVMARPGDSGAYEIGNVVICLAEANRAERNRNYSLKGEKNPAFGQNYWATASDTERKARGLKISKQTLGVKKSAATRALMSKAALAREQARRERI